MSPPLRLLVFGMACAASAPTLAALLEAGFAVEALVLPGGASAHPDRRSALTPQALLGDPLPCEGEGEQSASATDSPPPRFGDPRGEGVGGGGRSPQPAASPQILGRCGEPERLAAAAGVPVFRAAPDAPRVLALASGVDAIVVACFPVRLPPDLLARPRLGGLNVHPSLLPLGRGPEPVFWTLRRGERRTGATVHRLDAGWDTGSVVIQRAVAVLAGVRAPDLERDLMALGGTLLVEALPLLAAGRLVPIPQDDAQATRAPVPAPADWLVPTDLPAGWAFNFVRGVSPLGEPLAVRGPFGIVPVRDAVAHHPTERPDVLLEERPGGILRVRFSPGWVEFEPG